MNSADTNTHFLKHKDEVFVYLLGFLKNREDAEDVLQDLYLRIWSKRRWIKAETAKFYFFRIARNLCVDHFRRKKRNIEMEFSIQHEPGHDKDFEKRELSEIFRTAVDGLPPAYREVIFLKDICQMDTTEIVEITKSNANQVRVNLSRARSKIKEVLESIYKYENLDIQKN